MTCEIAIMNMHAVALAADSALTVKRWINGVEQTRYFNGSNKIFQLSNHHPVGLMIFDAASLQGVPWELILKEFRTFIKDTAYPSLKGYAEALFDFIKQHPHFFPQQRRKDILLWEIENLVYAILADASRSLKLNEPPEDANAASETLEKYLRAAIDAARKGPIPKVFPQDSDTQTCAAHGVDIRKRAEDSITTLVTNGTIHADRKVNAELVAELAVYTLYRKYNLALSGTGLVVAGYGTEDIYPGFCEFRCYGLLLDEFVYDEMREDAARIDRPAVVRPFATTTMVDTFLLGFSEDVYDRVGTEFEKSARSLADTIKAELNVPDIPNLDHHISNLQKGYTKSWTRSVADAHFQPLQDVVASLPTHEMAELAETLIMLESLKEKVTAPTQSVGGPIDVAVITKNEGLIWVKRKHFFDPEKNPRYFMRQKLLYS